MPIPIMTTPAPTFVEAGFRAVSAVSAVVATPAALRVGDDGGQAPPSAETLPPAVPDRLAVRQATESLNQYFALHRAELHFSVDDDTDRLVVKVVDVRDGSLIRQIPDEQALRMAQALHSEMPALFKQKA